MPTNTLSPEQKSVLLTKMAGWEERRHPYPNLYDKKNMALAWQLHMWKLEYEFNDSAKPYTDWWNNSLPWLEETAQEQWLDKILEVVK